MSGSRFLTGAAGDREDSLNGGMDRELANMADRDDSPLIGGLMSRRRNLAGSAGDREDSLHGGMDRDDDDVPYGFFEDNQKAERTDSHAHGKLPEKLF